MPDRLATVFALMVVCLSAGASVAADPQKASREPRKTPPEISRALLNPYLKVQTALAADDLYKAQAGAAEFTVAASAHRASDTNLMMISNRISAGRDRLRTIADRMRGNRGAWDRAVLELRTLLAERRRLDGEIRAAERKIADRERELSRRLRIKEAERPRTSREGKVTMLPVPGKIAQTPPPQKDRKAA